MRCPALVAALGLLFVLAVAPVATTAKADALDHILNSGTLTVAVPDNFPPFGMVGPDAQQQGYDIDTAALIADALKVKLKLVPIVSADRIPALTGGKVDLVISSLGESAEREKVIDFSIAYAPFFNGVFGPETVAVAKPEDLAGKTVAVTRGTIEDATLAKLAPPATTVIKRFDDDAATAVAFLGGRTELIATGNVVAAEILSQNPPKRPLVKFLLQNSPCHIGVKKGEARLLARINEIITAARRDGRLDKISQRWLKAPLDDPDHPAALTGN